MSSAAGSNEFPCLIFIPAAEVGVNLKYKTYVLLTLQVPHGAHHTWRPERRESLTRSHSWLNLRMNLWRTNSSTDRNGKSCPTGWTWATSRWKYGFRTGGWKRNDWWCANRPSLHTDDLWTWSWPAARAENMQMCCMNVAGRHTPSVCGVNFYLYECVKCLYIPVT